MSMAFSEAIFFRRRQDEREDRALALCVHLWFDDRERRRLQEVPADAK
jgi:hypothetical protein